MPDTNLLDRIKPKSIDVEASGQVHTVYLKPSITYDRKNGIHVVKYGSIDFPDEAIYYPDDKTLDPIRDALSDDISLILDRLLPQKRGRVLARGVYYSSLEKTIKHHTDRWNKRKEAEYGPRNITYAIPVDDRKIESLREIIREWPVQFAFVYPSSSINPYLLFFNVRSEFLREDEPPYSLGARLDFVAKREQQETSMILVFDGRNTVPNEPEHPSVVPYYIFKGYPRLLAICYFDINYPRSIGKIDRGLLVRGIRELKLWSLEDWSNRYRELDNYIRPISTA